MSSDPSFHPSSLIPHPLNEARVQQLLDEALDSDRTPEEVCAAAPELLPEVDRRWRQLRLMDAELNAFFPEQEPVANTRPAPASPHDGKLPRIPGYEVESILGRGGMGVVFQARHLRLKRLVALKMLLSGAYAGPMELERFRREAEAIAALRHPYIVQVYDVGDLAGQPFFTMEYVEGGSLAQQLLKTRTPIRQAVELVATLATAVQFAHKSGIIHRDLKPANILLTSEGMPKITDFGLARSVNGGPGVTLTGARLGTPSYMAPEQALGKTSAIGPAVDIYALGVVLYEMLAGRPPFEGSTAAEIERRVIAEEAAPPSLRSPKVTRDLDTICLKCLQKNPTRRYASAQDLADDLHRYLDGHPVLARPVNLLERTVKWVRRHPIFAVLSLALLLVTGTAAGTFIWLQKERNSRQANARTLIEAGIPRAYELGRVEKWHDAEQILANIESKIEEARSDYLRKRIERVQADIQFSKQLEHIRLSHASSLASSFSSEKSPYLTLSQQYATAFAAHGLNIDGTIETMVDSIRGSEIREQMVVALDMWALSAFLTNRPALQKQLLLIAQAADPDTVWHDRFRDSSIWRNRQELLKLAGDAVKLTKPIAAHRLAVLGLLLRKCGAKSESAKLLREALRRRPDDFWLNWEMGLALHTDKKYQEAVTYLRIVVALRPDEPWILSRLSGALSGAGQSSEAIAVARRAVELNPKDHDLRYNLAIDLLLAKQFDAVEVECRRILDIDPDNVQATYALASAMHRTKRYEEAISYYNKVIDLDPTHVHAWYYLALVLFELDRVDEAATAIAKIVRIDSAYIPGRLGLGRVYMQKENYAYALAEYRNIIRVMTFEVLPDSAYYTMDPETVYAFAWAGQTEALCALGRFGEARDSAKRALELPGLPEPNRQMMLEKIALCDKLRKLESKLPAMLVGEELPKDVDTLRALADWLYKDKHFNYAASQRYQEVFAKQPALFDDLNSRIRYEAACAAVLAASGKGEDAGKLNSDVRASLRNQALAWLRAESNARAKQKKNIEFSIISSAARTARTWLTCKELASVRESAALTRLPEKEKRDWDQLWMETKLIESCDPMRSLNEAHALLARKKWSEAVNSYVAIMNQYPIIDGQYLFEYAAAQLLSGDHNGYRQTCQRMVDGAVNRSEPQGSPKPPPVRAFLAARVTTLTPSSPEEVSKVEQLSAGELNLYAKKHWSLTERGALNYRGNDFKRAISSLEQSLAIESKPNAAVLNWLWLAMADHKLGEKEDARFWLNKAAEWLDTTENEIASGVSPELDYHNWLEAQILRKEAEKLLSQPTER